MENNTAKEKCFIFRSKSGKKFTTNIVVTNNKPGYYFVIDRQFVDLLGRWIKEKEKENPKK